LEDIELGLGTSQSLDTEILLLCLDVVHVSDEEETTGNSEEDLNLNANEMVDSDDEAFMNPPMHGGTKKKSATLVKAPRTMGPPNASMMTKLKKNYDMHRKFYTEWAAKKS